MASVIIISFVLFAVIYYINCFQNLWKLEPSYCEITNVNRSLANYVNWTCRKRSRQDLYMDLNLSFAVDCNSNSLCRVLIIGYQFRSNEYRKGPIEFSMGLCEYLGSQNYDIPSMFANSNLHPCPIKKNYPYYIKNVSMHAENLPPLIPEGRWKLELRFMYNKVYPVFSTNWYGTIWYPVPFRNETYRK